MLPYLNYFFLIFHNNYKQLKVILNLLLIYLKFFHNFLQNLLLLMVDYIIFTINIQHLNQEFYILLYLHLLHTYIILHFYLNRILYILYILIDIDNVINLMNLYLLKLQLEYLNLEVINYIFNKYNELYLQNVIKSVIYNKIFILFKVILYY